MKHVHRAFITWWKPRRTFGRIREQISKNSRRSRGFSFAQKFSQTFPRFSAGYGGTDNIFYFFYKIIFRQTIYEASMYTLIYFMKLYILTTLRQPTVLFTSFSCFIALDQSKRSYYPNYFTTLIKINLSSISKCG